MPVVATPNFSCFTERIFAKSRFQKKALLSFLARQDERYFARAETAAGHLLALCRHQRIEIEDMVDAYLKMCQDMVGEKIRFLRTGSYSCKGAEEAYRNVYADQAQMAAYMRGLALSQFLWPNHYAMYDFFLEGIQRLGNVDRHLEIGPGHGLYLAAALQRFPNAAFTAIDISETSIRISRAMVAQFTGTDRCDFRVADATRQPMPTADLVVMGEVLEHLDSPATMLATVSGCLATGGCLFVTTCANCPAIDHVYLYDSVGHIRGQLNAAGFEILVDLPLAVGDHDESLWESQRVEVNYAAWLCRSGEAHLVPALASGAIGSAESPS